MESSLNDAKEDMKEYIDEQIKKMQDEQKKKMLELESRV